MKEPVNSRNCFLCRVMRGLAFGGLGAGIGGFGGLLLGFNQTYAMIAAMFGAIFVTLLAEGSKRDRQR